MDAAYCSKNSHLTAPKRKVRREKTFTVSSLYRNGEISCSVQLMLTISFEGLLDVQVEKGEGKESSIYERNPRLTVVSVMRKSLTAWPV